MQSSIKAVNTRKITWGSDNVFHRETTFDLLLRVMFDHCCFLTKREKDDIMGGNAARMFTKWGVMDDAEEMPLPSQTDQDTLLLEQGHF